MRFRRNISHFTAGVLVTLAHIVFSGQSVQLRLKTVIFYQVAGKKQLFAEKNMP
jgi:hypothetical protein